MKTRDLKTELRLKQKLITRGTGTPSTAEGKDGDFTIRFIDGQGLLFFYKWGNDWYSSRMSLYTRRRNERQEPVILPAGKEPTSTGELCITAGDKISYLKNQNKKMNIVSIDKDGLADANSIKFERSNSATPTITHGSNNDDLFLYNDDGDARITIRCKDANYDSYINYVYQLVGETPTQRGWCVGPDMSATNRPMKWLKFDGNTPNVTPSYSASDLTVMELTNQGNLSIDGTMTIGSIGSTAGNFLTHSGGTVHSRSAAQTRADIGSIYTIHEANIAARMGTLNTWYISNQSFGTSIAAADWATTKFNYALFNCITATTLTGWRNVGEFSSSTDYEFELWDVTVPSDGTAEIATAAKIGSTQSLSATANAIYTIGQTGLTYSVAAGHQLYLLRRYTSGSGNKYTYETTTLEFINT